METSIKKDLQFSALIGLIAGLLAIPTLRNLGLALSFGRIASVVLGLVILCVVGYWLANWLNRWLPFMRQFVKFGIVGGMNTLLDLGILNLLIFIFKIASGIHYSLFKSISFSIAVISSYFWNKYWTFESVTKVEGGEFAKFFLVNLVGFGINVGTASLIVNFIARPIGVSPALWANIGALSATLVALFWNFIGLKLVVFKK